MNNAILLHVCCAPCATAVVEKLRSQGMDPSGYFCNPSIHPWKELQRRLEAVRAWAPEAGFEVECHEEYLPEDNIRMLLSADNRCLACFGDRMMRTALKASELGIPRFTTTLAISPYQNLELIREAGLRASMETGVEYVHGDFRNLYRRSIELSRLAGIYRQPYCGCIFSERDRYLKRNAPGTANPSNGY